MGVDVAVSRCGRVRWVGVSGFGRLPVPDRQPGEETILHDIPSGAERPSAPGPPGTAPGPDAPIYAELARRWQAEGRSVPGLPDPVWESLAAPAGAQPAASGPGRSPAWGSEWNPGAGSERNPG